MSLRAVLDTNIFISGIHWADVPQKILRAWMEGKFILVSSLPIIDEMVKTLMAFKVPLEPEDISWWESLLLEKSLSYSQFNASLSSRQTQKTTNSLKQRWQEMRNMWSAEIDIS